MDIALFVKGMSYYKLKLGEFTNLDAQNVRKKKNGEKFDFWSPNFGVFNMQLPSRTGTSRKFVTASICCVLELRESFFSQWPLPMATGSYLQLMLVFYRPLCMLRFKVYFQKALFVSKVEWSMDSLSVYGTTDWNQYKNSLFTESWFSSSSDENFRWYTYTD